MKTIGLVFIGFVAIAAAWFAYDPMQTSVIHWVAAGVCLAALVGIIIILATGRQPRPEKTKLEPDGGDWLAKIYAIGDRIHWPKFSRTKKWWHFWKWGIWRWRIWKSQYSWAIIATIVVILTAIIAIKFWVAKSDFLNDLCYSLFFGTLLSARVAWLLFNGGAISSGTDAEDDDETLHSFWEMWLVNRTVIVAMVATIIITIIVRS